VHPVLRARAEKRFGLFTTAEALLVGYAPSEIRSLCAGGRWVRLRRGVLVGASDLAAGEEGGRRYAMDCLAVLLSLDRSTALVSRGSAARLWNLPVPRSVDPTIRLTDTEQWRRGQDWRMACAPLQPAER